MSTLPPDFPPLQVLAEVTAREYFEAGSYVIRKQSQSTFPLVFDTDPNRFIRIDIARRLLVDLHRLETRSLWLSWLATQVGLSPSQGLLWVYDPVCGESVASWTLTDAHRRHWSLTDWLPAFDATGLTRPDGREGYRAVPNLPTDPVEALIAALVEVTRVL